MCPKSFFSCSKIIFSRIMACIPLREVLERLAAIGVLETNGVDALFICKTLL